MTARKRSTMTALSLLALGVGLLAAPAGAAGAPRFPCKAFDRATDRNERMLQERFRPAVARVAVRQLREARRRVAREDCDRFGYRAVHRWLRRAWKRADKAHDDAEVGSRPWRRAEGRREALEPVIWFVEGQARKRGIRLRAILRAGDE